MLWPPSRKKSSLYLIRAGATPRTGAPDAAQRCYKIFLIRVTVGRGIWYVEMLRQDSALQRAVDVHRNAIQRIIRTGTITRMIAVETAPTGGPRTDPGVRITAVGPSLGFWRRSARKACLGRTGEAAVVS